MLPSMNDFGQFIRLRRIEKGMSQRALAKRAGLSSGGVSMIERGERERLEADTVRRLADALDEGYDELFRHLKRPESVLV